MLQTTVSPLIPPPETHIYMYAAAIALTVLLAFPIAAVAAELQIWTAQAGATVLWEIGPEFERSTGHKLAKGEAELGIVVITQILRSSPTSRSSAA